MMRYPLVALMFLVVGLMASASLKPTEASWQSSRLMGQNQGYCQDGVQHADISKCRENRTDKPAQRKKPNNYVAGAQQLPSANITPVVLSEQRTQVWRTFNLNPDSSAVDVIVAKVTKAGKGQVEFEDNMGFSTYPQNSQKYRCNIKQTAGLSIFYTSPTGFKGTDSFEMELFNGRGASQKASFRVRVK